MKKQTQVRSYRSFWSRICATIVAAMLLMPFMSSTYAFADENSVSSGATMPAHINQAATAIDVTVTDKANFNVFSDTNEAEVTPITVTNNLNSVGVVVQGIEASSGSKDDFTMLPYGSDFSDKAVDSGYFSIAYDENGLAEADGILDLYGAGLTREDLIFAQESKVYEFTGESAVFSHAVLYDSTRDDNVQIANIIFTVGMYTADEDEPEEEEDAEDIEDTQESTSVSDAIFYSIELLSDDEYKLIISDTDLSDETSVATGNVDVNGYASQRKIPWRQYAQDIIEVETIGTVAPTSTAYWFYNLKNCETFTLDTLNTSNVTDMYGMFYLAGHSTSTFELNLAQWDTSKVVNMGSMFYGAGFNATTWSIGNLKNWDVSSVTNMVSMFERIGYNATELSLNIQNWHTENVVSMSSMFYGAGYNSETVLMNLSGWDTAKVTNMSNMFSNVAYESLSFELNLANWRTDSLNSVDAMFYNAGCNADDFKLDLTSWDTSNIANMNSVFGDAGGNATNYSLITEPNSSWNA